MYCSEILTSLIPYTTLFRSQMINRAWSWGVSATYRRMTNAMDDVRINALCGVRHGTLWPIANPGDELTLWGTTEMRSEEHTSELQSRENLVCRLLLEKKKYQ